MSPDNRFRQQAGRMMKTGLCSITFKDLPPEEVVALAARAGLDAVEWAGQEHAPPTASRAELERVRRLTEEHDLLISSYGSYYEVMKCKGHAAVFEAVLDAADALGTSLIRIWSSGLESREADDDYYRRMADRTRDLALLAEQRGVTLAFEFHGGSLNDTADSAVRILRTINQPNVKTYWQPLHRDDPALAEREIRELLPWLANVHCYHWINGVRHLLAEDRPFWQNLLGILARNAFGNAVLLEFTKDDNPDNMIRDAATLRELVRGAESG